MFQFNHFVLTICVWPSQHPPGFHTSQNEETFVERCTYLQVISTLKKHLLRGVLTRRWFQHWRNVCWEVYLLAGDFSIEEILVERCTHLQVITALKKCLLRGVLTRRWFQHWRNISWEVYSLTGNYSIEEMFVERCTYWQVISALKKY